MDYSIGRVIGIELRRCQHELMGAIFQNLDFLELPAILPNPSNEHQDLEFGPFIQVGVMERLCEIVLGGEYGFSFLSFLDVGLDVMDVQGQLHDSEVVELGLGEELHGGIQKMDAAECLVLIDLVLLDGVQNVFGVLVDHVLLETTPICHQSGAFLAVVEMRGQHLFHVLFMHEIRIDLIQNRPAEPFFKHTLVFLTHPQQLSKQHFHGHRPLNFPDPVFGVVCVEYFSQLSVDEAKVRDVHFEGRHALQSEACKHFPHPVVHCLVILAVI